MITRKEFYNIPGALLSDLTSNVKFPNKPDVVAYSTSLEGPVNVEDNYGLQFQGFVTAPITGDYIFYINSGKVIRVC